MSKTGKEKRLDQLHAEIKELNPEILSDLNKMIRLYSQSYDNLIIALRRDERTALEEYKKANDLYER